MKTKNGFTLVELLAVIVILGLLMAVAVPSAMTLANKVKRKSYDTKISLIEDAAKLYGQANLTYVKEGTDPLDTSSHYLLKIKYGSDEKLESISAAKQASGYSSSYTLKETSENASGGTLKSVTKEFWGFRIPLEYLVSTGYLDWDEEGVCENCSDAQKSDYDNILINPVDNYIINKCYMYIYYKYNRVYVKFDADSCNIAETDRIVNGHEYKPLA